MRHDLRAKIEAKAARYKITGVWTPERAEAVAKRLGVEPPNPQPDPAYFMDEPFWSFIQGIAWITWRTPETVRDLSDRYRKNHREWCHTGDGAVCGRISPERATFFLLELMEAAGLRDGNPPLVPVECARKQLWQALQAGRLVANAIDRETRKRRKQRRKLAAMEFLELELGTDTEHGRATIVTLQTHPWHHPYRDPMLKSADVLRLWPAKAPVLAAPDAPARGPTAPATEPAPVPSVAEQAPVSVTPDNSLPPTPLPNSRHAKKQAVEKAMMELYKGCLPATKQRQVICDEIIKHVRKQDPTFSIHLRSLQRYWNGR